MRGAGIPFHPGAERCYREAGVLKQGNTAPRPGKKTGAAPG